jgi:hypothetical protein
MKTRLLAKLIAVAVVLGGTASLGLAQDRGGWACPYGNQPGYGRSVKFKQRNAQIAPPAPRAFGYCQRPGQGWRQGYGPGNCPGWGQGGFGPGYGYGRGWRNGNCPWQNRN